MPTSLQTLIKRFFILFSYLAIVGLLIVAINLRSPYLFSIRSYEVPILLLLSSLLILFFYFKSKGLKRTLSLSLLVVVITLTVWGEAAYQYRKHHVLNIAQPQLLGEHFIVGYEDIETIKPLVSQGLVGGIFLTRRNIIGKSIEDLQQEIATLQQLRIEAGLPLLMVTTDQEGGIVSHMSPLIERMPPISSLIQDEVSQESLINSAMAYGRQQGQSLANIGITINFSPVVDLKSDSASNRLDFHSKINQRAISHDPSITAEVAQAYSEGLRSQGVRATLKHFPGLGNVPNDTHHFSASLHMPISELKQSDWLPFKTVAENTDALIMLGHVILPEIDSENPVSFSKAVVQGIIRKGWGHEGILITDDMTMRAASSHGLCQATVKALNAGGDLLLISYDYEIFYESMYCLNQAYLNGQLDKEMLQLSHDRLLTYYF